MKVKGSLLPEVRTSASCGAGALSTDLERAKDLSKRFLVVTRKIVIFA
jgi:hypothetical protein